MQGPHPFYWKLGSMVIRSLGQTSPTEIDLLWYFLDLFCLITILGGGFKHVLFSDIFQMGWFNRQLALIYANS